MGIRVVFGYLLSMQLAALIFLAWAAFRNLVGLHSTEFATKEMRVAVSRKKPGIRLHSIVVRSLGPRPSPRNATAPSVTTQPENWCVARLFTHSMVYHGGSACATYITDTVG
jgi:hypothetical protein